MQTPVDEWEEMVKIGANNTMLVVKQVMDSLGNRPFLKKRLTEQEELDAYQALRMAVDGMYNYADGIRMELEARLSGISEEERIALGLQDSEIRRIAYTLTLKYVERMNRLSKKLGIPIEGLEPVEPLPPVVDDLGGEMWQTPSLMQLPESNPGGITMPDSALSPTEPLLPLSMTTAQAPF